jgi:hypothetical protein
VTAVPQIALIKDDGVPLDDLTLAVWANALDQQVEEIARAWGIQYTPVVYYERKEGLPIDCRLALIMMTLGIPGAEGYHDDQLGIIFSRNLYTTPDETSVTISHEDAEEEVDDTCDKYGPWDDQHEQALESADRVEGDVYTIQGKIGNETRDVVVSNWLYPSAFDPKGKKPFDKLGYLEEWNGMTKGGYVILRNKATGETSDVFARARRAPHVLPASPLAHEKILSKLARPDSRLMRRLRQG